MVSYNYFSAVHRLITIHPGSLQRVAEHYSDQGQFSVLGCVCVCGGGGI